MQDQVEELLAQALLLPIEDQFRLLKDLIKMYVERGGELPASTLENVLELEKTYLATIGVEKAQKTHRSILEFEGMDQESWKDVDVKEYINQERASWD